VSHTQLSWDVMKFFSVPDKVVAWEPHSGRVAHDLPTLNPVNGFEEPVHHQVGVV
jgi:hypothetical protein